MPCEIDSIDDLFTCLRDAVQGDAPNQTLVLSGDLFAAAGEFAGLFAQTSLTVDQAGGQPIVTLAGAEVHVSGESKLFPGGRTVFAYTVTIVGTFPGKPALVLGAKPAGSAPNWTFAANFGADFPQYRGHEGPRLAWLPSFLPGTVFLEPSFRAATAAAPAPAGLTFKGKLDTSQGSLTQLGSFFVPPVMPVAGPLTVRPDTYPLVAFTADPGYSIPQIVDVSVALDVEDAQTVEIEEVDGAAAVERPAETSLDLVGRPPIQGFDDITISAPILQGPYAWVLTAETHNPAKYSIAGGLSALSKFAGGQALALPAGFDALGAMYLQSVSVAFAPSRAPTVDSIGFRIASDPARATLWKAPILGLAVERLAVAWDVVGLADGQPSLFGTMSGSLLIGADPSAGQTSPVRLNAQLDLSGLDAAFAPDVGFAVFLDPKTPVSVSSLFRQFTGVDLDLGLTITDLRLEGSTGSRTLQFVAGLTPDWTLPVPARIDEITLAFLYAPNAFTATIGLRIELVGLGFLLGAAYRGKGEGWLFAGGLLPASQGTSLKTVLDAVAPGYFPATLPANLGAIELRDLSSSFDTKSGDFHFNGALAWPFELGALKLVIEASLELAKQPDTSPTGVVRGALRIDSFSVGAAYTFGVERNESIAFEIAWRGVTLTCIYSKNDDGEPIVRANLGGVSFGDILGWLVGLAEPSGDFRLSAPWDVLYKVRFDDLWLEFNLATKAIGIRYDIALDLGIVSLDSIGLSYARRAGQPSIDIQIAGRFIGTTYPKSDPLSWDLLNDPPPAPPGKADALLDLRYLGLGQSVTFRDTRSLRKVLDVIEALEADFTPVDGKDNPLASLTKLKYSGDGNWLIGADFTVMGAVSLAGVFADPSLYGLRVGLAGPKVKSLAGLQFEILYRKVTDTVGVYHVELTLPDVMRQLQFGAVSVTLPIVTVDVYTNGNFRVDFGFPVNGDWSRSFCVQAGPFIGYGGFYFALLDGSTSEKVPAITNGTFAPVIEFGLGLQVGMGRTIDKGILKAGATLTMQGIVEGVLGWFNPADRSLPSEMYYRIQGSVAIVGQIYGSVDFVIVKAKVEIVARASVTVTIEAHAPIEVQLNVSVTASASVEFLFFTISFSFSATLNLSFTIGSGSTPPWRPTQLDHGERPLQLLGQRSHHRPVVPTAAQLLRAASGPGPRAAMDWAPRQVIAGDVPVDVEVMLVPALTPAVEPGSDHPAVQIVISLLVPTSTPASARHAEEVLRVEHESPETVAFNRLAGGLLRWAIGALGDRPAGEQVTIADLEAIACFLGNRSLREATFTYDRVSGLLERNFRLLISNPIGPTGGLFEARSDLARGATAQPIQGAMFPMIPEIEMTPQDRDPVAFWRHSCANDDYHRFLETYYAQLQPDAEAGVATDPFAPRPCADGPVGLVSSAQALRSAPLPPGCDAGLRPVSETVFCDWFALVTQQAVQLAADLLNAYPYRPTGTETLREIADGFDKITLAVRTGRGDTPGTIAAAFGVAPAELRRVNPWLGSPEHGERLPEGSTVYVAVGPTVGAIAEANIAYPLRAGAHLRVAGVRYQVRDGASLGGVAHAFGIEDVAELVVATAAKANADNAGLLRAGAAIAIPALDRVVRAVDLAGEDTLDRLAATAFTRARQWPAANDSSARAWAAWYVASIGQLNPTFSGTIQVPIASLGADGRIVDSGTRTTYALASGDTIASVAAAFALLALAPSDPRWATFRSAVTTTPPPPPREGTVVHLPAVTMAVRSGDSLTSIALSLFESPAKSGDRPLTALAALARANRLAPILATRAVLALPQFDYPVADGDALGALAQRFDLTVAELAAAVRDDRGILAPFDGTTSLTVPDVPAIEVDRLVDDLTRLGSFNTLSTTASRFVLAGMRVPQPGPTGAPQGVLGGLFDILGQQFPAPVGATLKPYDIGLRKGTTAPWFCFEPPPGDRAQGDCVDATTVTLSPGFFAANSPSTTLDPLTVTGPAPMALYDLVAPSFAVSKTVAWQSATEVPLPGPTAPTGPVSGVAGTLSVWPFPQALLAQLETGPLAPTGPTAVTPPFELLAAPATPRAGAGTPIERYSWATAIPLRVTRALDDSGAVVPGTYEIVGAGQDGRDLLLSAWTALLDGSSTADRLYLLHSPGTAGPNDGGLVSDTLSTSQTFVLRTNLSTVTHSGPQLTASADASDYYARLSSIKAFLEAVWEASITQSGGFHLTYADASGEGLPDELFAADGSASLTAVLILGSQSYGALPQRGLHAFNNCAVVADGLDASATRVLVRLADPAPQQLRRTASVQPGVVGFGLARIHPAGATAAGPTGMTRRLHSLVGYRVAAGSDFSASNEGLPIVPADDEPAWLHLPPGPTHAYWSYEQSVPISRFGIVNDCPRSPALPDASANPYRGITGPTGPGGARPLSSTRIELAYQDLYGNETATTHPPGGLDVPVGYTDELIGVSAWPGSALDYRFEPLEGDDGAQLRTTLTLQTGRYLAGQGNAYDAALRSAAADGARYGALYYQMQQRDVEFALGSNLGTAAADPGELRAAMTGFVTKAKLFADSAAALAQVTASATQGDTLAALAERLATTPAMLLEVNADVDGAALFPGTYVKPKLVAAPAMNTLVALAREIVGRSGVAPDDRSCAGVDTPDATCTPSPPGRALTLVAAGFEQPSRRAAEPPTTGSFDAVAIDNATAPLTPATVLRIAQRTGPALTPQQASDSLAATARRLGCTVYAEVVDPDQPAGAALAVGLLVDNWDVPDLVADGVTLAVEGIEITTKDATFASIFAELTQPTARPDLTRGDFAAAIREVPGIFRAGKTLRYATLVVPQPPAPTGPAPAQPTFSLRDALLDPASRTELEQVAQLNRCVPSLFALGTALLLGYSCCKAGEDDSPRSLATAAHISLAQLAQFNAPTPVGAGVQLVVPELTVLTDPPGCWAAYAPSETDSLATMASALGATATELADLNRELPGVFRAGASVTVGGTVIAVGPRDSLQSAFDRSQASDWAAFVQALEEPANAGIYASVAAIVTPLPRVPGSGADTPAITALAASLRVAPETLLDANRTQRGFLRDGAQVRGPDASTVSVGPYDTVLTVLRRLGGGATIADVVKLDGATAGLLSAGAALLIAPAPTGFAAPFAAVVPPAGSAGEDRIVFPVQVWLDIFRSPGLVDPQFAGEEAVAHSRSALVPRIADAAGATRLALDGFAAAFELAFAAHRLKCAVASGAAADADANAGGRIFAVNFGVGGVSTLAVDASRPAFYALQPLSTTPWSGDLRVPTYVSGRGLCGDADRRVQGVDVDDWMRQLLATIDLALTPGYAVPAFRMGATAGTGGLLQASSAALDPVDALARPASRPARPDPLAGPLGLASAAMRSRPALGSLGVAGATGCSGPTASGPGDYDRLVGAKASIASALRERVMPIVLAPGATGELQTESAREALYQQMLVRLSDGYDVSAIVELPVDVQSPLVTPWPGATGPAPPRASGKVVPVVHTVAQPPGGVAAVDEPPPASIAAVAAGYGVDPAFLAEVITNLGGVLEPGTAIAGHTVTEHDTLSTVAAAVGVPTDPSAPGYWSAWTAFVAGFAQQAVFVPGASFPLSGVARSAAAGDRLTTLAEFFARDVATVGRANQARAAIVRSGALSVPGYPTPYPVTDLDTLTSIAAGVTRLNPSSPPLVVDDLCRLLADAPAFLAQDATLRIVEQLPGVSLSTAKVSLGRVGADSGPPPPLTFLVTVKQEADQAALLLNLDYSINELEYAIRDVPGAGKYQASSWLTFVLPLDGSGGGVDAGARTAIPQIQVPIPLRAYPPPSVLLAQSGLPSKPGSPVPALAREWDYRFDVQTRKAAQDTDHLRAAFGERGAAQLGDAIVTNELMRWLAAFVEGSTALRDDLARLPALAPGEVDKNAAYAVQALSLIAERIGGALSSGQLFMAVGATAVQTYAYEMTTLASGPELRTLTLVPEPPGPTGSQAIWPQAYVKSATAPTGETGPDAGFLPLGGTGGVYTYPAGFAAGAAQTYRFRFDERDVIRNPTGRGAIAVTRNDRLIAHGPLGPTGNPRPVPTFDGFIYRTPFVQFVDPLVPLIDVDALIDISTLGPGAEPRPLAEHLLNMLRATTDVAPGLPATADIELAAGYGFTLAGELIATTPILLAPSAIDGDVSRFADALAASLNSWRRATGVAEDVGLLALKLTVYATDTPGGASSRKPIVRFTDLRLPMADVRWPQSEESSE